MGELSPHLSLLRLIWAAIKHPFRCRTCRKREAVEIARQAAVEKVRNDLVARGSTAFGGPLYLWFTPDGDPTICNGTPPPHHQRPAELVGVELALDVGRVSGTLRRQR